MPSIVLTSIGTAMLVIAGMVLFRVGRKRRKGELTRLALPGRILSDLVTIGGHAQVKGEAMSEPNTDYKIHLNGNPVPTLSVEEDQYDTSLLPEDGALAITRVELFDPKGALLARFDFAHAFAVPNGEQGILTIWGQDEGGYGLNYHVLSDPDYVEEERDFYLWDGETNRLRAADYVGGEPMFRK